MSNSYDITVAINSYRNAPMLRLCIESVCRATQRCTAQIVVADSATQEDTYDMMRQEYPDIEFLPDRKNIGFGAMVNKCLDVAKGEYIFLINSDTIVREETIDQLLEYFRAHPDIGVLAPAQLSFTATPLLTCFRFYTPLTILYRRTPLGRLPFAQRHLRRFEMRDYDHRNPRTVDWVMGSAMMVRRETVKRVGGMDPQFFMYMEDVDWCRRFWNAGYSVVYHPGITMYHYYGKGSAGRTLWFTIINRLTWIHISSAIKYFWKYRTASLPRHDNSVITTS